MKLLGGHAAILGSILLQYGVGFASSASSETTGTAAGDCGTMTIRTREEADDVRSRCPVIHGNLTIESSKDSLPEYIDLGGIEVVQGSFQTTCEKLPGPPGFDDFGDGGDFFTMCSGMFNNNKSSSRVKMTIEAPTLREVTGRFTLSGKLPLRNFTAPNLRSIGGLLYVTGSSLEYLDLTELEEVGHLSLTNSGVREIRHRQLKRILGSKSTDRLTEIVMHGLPNLSSVDSWLSGPIEVQRIEIDQKSAEMTQLTIGVKKADQVIIKGMGNMALTFGTDETEEMNLARVAIRGLSDVNRNENAKNVKVGTFDVQNNGFERLDIPFDDLGMLYMMSEHTLETLTLPPAAEEYTNLTVAIWDCENLDLTSEYIKDEAGKKVKGWYWPKKRMGRIAVYNTSVDETFFNSLINYRLSIADAAQRPKIKSIDLWPPAKEKRLLDCTRLKMLMDAGVVEDHVVCDEFSSMSKAGPGMNLRSRNAAGFALAAALLAGSMAVAWV